MIKLSQYTDKGGERIHLKDREEPLQVVLDHLIAVHIGWGGKVLECSENKVVAASRCLDNYDVATYTGSVEEIASLVTLITYQTMICTGWDAKTRHLLQKRSGERRARVALGIMGKHVDPGSDQLQGHRLEDVCAAYVLHKETGCSMVEALCMA